MSRIGRKPVAVPKEVKIQVSENGISVEGPKGKLQCPVSNHLRIEQKEGQLNVVRNSDTKIDKSLQGLTRALILNMIVGVTAGYSKELEIIGVGFKAQSDGKKLTMNLGFCHPVIIPIPAGIKIETPKATQVVVSGIDKEAVGKVAAEIRSVYPPEPYKGKGVRYRGEFVKKKVGKAQAATK